jgi:hypothetical protein
MLVIFHIHLVKLNFDFYYLKSGTLCGTEGVLATAFRGNYYVSVFT